MHKILIFGPQGAGKGTQAEILASSLNIPAMSMGDLLRREVQKGSQIGIKINKIIISGKLVPDQVALQVLESRLKEPDAANGYIIDGYPRNIEQLKEFLSIDKPTDVIMIELSDEEAIKRLSSRRVCVGCAKTYNLKYNSPKVADICDECGGSLVQRDDDKPEAIKQRLNLYHSETEPISVQFEKLGVIHRIDGSGSIEEVSKLIKQALNV